MFNRHKKAVDALREADRHRAEIEDILQSRTAEQHEAARAMRRAADIRANALVRFEQLIVGLLHDHAGEATSNAVAAMIATERERLSNRSEN